MGFIFEDDDDRQITRYIGQRIRKRRQEMRISLDAVALRIGVTFQQVQKYERGVNRISAAKLYKLCAFMGTPLSYYFPDTPTELQLPPKAIALVEAWLGLDDTYRHMLEEIAYAFAMQKRTP